MANQRLIRNASLGIASATFHPRFSEVNPMKPSGKDWKEEREKTRRDLVIIRSQRMKYDIAISKGARVLPVIQK